MRKDARTSKEVVEMIRLILISSLVVFFAPSLAGADEDVECEIEVHDDAFTEVEYENDLTGVECSAIIPPGTTPSAEDQACIELCRAVLPSTGCPVGTTGVPPNCSGGGAGA